MAIYLTPEFEQLVESKVKSGHYKSPSEVIGEALRLVERRDRVFALNKVRFESGSRKAGNPLGAESCSMEALCSIA